MCQKSGSLTSFQRHCPRTVRRSIGTMDSLRDGISTRSLSLATDLNPIYPEIHRFRLIYTRVFHARPSLLRTIFLILYEMNFSTKHDLAFLSNYRWMYSGNFSIFSGSFIFSSGIKNSETSISFFFKNHYFIVARRIVVQNFFFQIG